ncbi:MAG TPA: C4-dicarboxylate ABC transporter [Halieaceae bacterium]|nr:MULTISPECIES: TRAP transporter large permease subunit [Haliea]HBQ40062.1 C4-dicarboxylate ABC transporter [Halieaceae bacterium]MAY91869.1 C4-dicarboxylate ABC transporter [Haliea sp.]MBK41793.1 C4-dicarboxylate ABC transporter [Haliea sp.]MBP70342.1 C4-dicarboxylate ABC transporter [Haliea sp.]HCD54461.1 C4-dicarboxylate ABC transporter [Halieaceae bacterium]
MDGTIALYLFACICLLLMLGFPVAFTLAGASLAFAAVGIIAGHFDPAFLAALPARIFGTINNDTLIAVPLFILMGVILEKSRIAEQLLGTMSRSFGAFPGGLGIAVVLVGMLLAASTGIVGATVVTMGLLSLPSMLKGGYDPALAAGTICATGTLGQIIPPSIALVLLGDVLSNAYQQAQLNVGIFNPKTVSVGDLFMGALLPGLLLVALYLAYIIAVAHLNPRRAPNVETEPVSTAEILGSLAPPLALISLVLGSILAGAATPTEAAGVGATGALLLAWIKREMPFARLRETVIDSMKVTCMVFMILIGAAVFSLVFRGFGGEDLIHHWFDRMPGGVFGATLIVMLVIFLLGFILDFIEITFVVVPIVGPVLLMMGLDPIWLGIMIALNLQTSFLTPPFGFALFYLRGVAPAALHTSAIYRGVIPFILIQLLVLAALWIWPPLATWLPAVLK